MKLKCPKCGNTEQFLEECEYEFWAKLDENDHECLADDPDGMIIRWAGVDATGRIKCGVCGEIGRHADWEQDDEETETP